MKTIAEIIEAFKLLSFEEMQEVENQMDAILTPLWVANRDSDYDRDLEMRSDMKEEEMENEQENTGDILSI